MSSMAMTFMRRRGKTSRGYAPRGSLRNLTPVSLIQLPKKKAATKVKAKTALGYGRRRKLNMFAPKVTIGGGGSFSRFALSQRASPRVSVMKKAAASNYAIHNYSEQMMVAEGFQKANVATWFSLPQLKEVLGYITNPVVTGVPPTQYVLESLTGQMLITNSSLATAYVDIYDIVRRRDDNDAGTDCGSPVSAWQAGLYDQSGISTIAGQTYINSLPTDSRLFRDTFKVIKRTRVSLAQGATHKHDVNLKPNRLVDQSLLTRAGGDLAGITCYTMVVAYGQPASVPQEGAPSIVTTASLAIDFVTAVRIKYTYVQDRTNSWFVQDQLYSLLPEQVVSAGAGAIVPNQKV